MPVNYLEDCPVYETRCFKLTPLDLDKLEAVAVEGQRQKGSYGGLVVIDAYTLEQLVEAARAKVE